MRYFISFIFLLTSVFGHCNLPRLWFENFQNVMIESLPMNRVYLDYGTSVFSFEVPADFMNMQDTSLFCNLARTLGYSTYRFTRPSILDEFVISNANGTKLLQAHWEFRMCGLDLYPSQYTKDFCSEHLSGETTDFISLEIMENAMRSNVWSNSLISFPFVSNPWVTIPHYEYRQCFRYCQSMFMSYLKTNKTSDKRFLNAKITTIIPDMVNYRRYYFEFWAMEYYPTDVLKLRRIMNSIQHHTNKENFRIYGEVIYENENVKIEQGWRMSPDRVVEMGKKMFYAR